MAWLAREAPDTALCAAVTATAALWWPDEIVGKAATFCRCPHHKSLPADILCGTTGIYVPAMATEPEAGAFLQRYKP